jgi:epoxyqueuosine reductase QueG
MTWLNQYRCPPEVVMDRGKEFIGDVKRMLVEDYGINCKAITTQHPQANAMVKQAHQTIHNHIRFMNIKGKADINPDYGWKGVLSAVAFAMRATLHTTAQATPSQLVFGLDHH